MNEIRLSTKRSDIQAMRALAVGAVLLYHLWPRSLPGGFIGVDVFFVISGFLITKHILDTIQRESPREFLLRFYARRARRLIPAAAVVLAFSMLASLALQAPTKVEGTARQIIASALFFQNWLLASDAVDYLAANNVPTVVQHFWSLSVEEQFYIVWPMLLLGLTLTSKARAVSRHLTFSAIAALAILSFTWSVYETMVAPAMAYFVTPVRAWQLAAGGMLTFIHLKSTKLRLILPWVGVAIVISGALHVSAARPYPGLWAIIPVVGTALVILGGPSRARLSVERVSNWAPLQSLGDISYSVYLWHWPLIVLLPLAIHRELDSHLKLFIIILSLLLARASYTWLENPVRRSQFLQRHPLRSILTGASALACVVALSLYAVAQSKLAVTQSRLALSNNSIHTSTCLGAKAIDDESCPSPWGLIDPTLIMAAPEDKPLPWPDRCSNGLGKNSRALCQYGDKKGNRTILLWGDSHAGSWAPAFDAAGRREHFRVLVAMRHGCPSSLTAPIATVMGRKISSREQAHCVARNQWVLDKVVQKADQVVLANMTSDYVFRTLAKGNGYEKLLDRLKLAGKPVTMMQDVPLTGDRNGHRRNGPDCLASDPSKCTNPVNMALDTDRVIRQLLKDGYGAHLKFVPVASRFCADRLCYFAIGGVSVYFDASHLSNTYSTSLGPWLARAIKAAKPLRSTIK